MKARSVRIQGDQAKELAVLARVEGVTVSEAVRTAISRYIATCRADQEFKARLKKRAEEDREILERLTE